MFELAENLEDVILSKIEIEQCIKDFDPEIQEIFYDAYGKNLEAIPKELLYPGCRTEDLLMMLQKLRSVRSQKVILMRFGIITGKPMTLDAVANEMGITRERVRQIESLFLRSNRPCIRRRKPLDHLYD